ncbi:MAG TPA: cation diffusion facilitator family transporter [Solirubrobacteraceae bacterium]|nr:cation diffusion facilitator family transporter [Solirubrobacteraceae bacterium]
MVKPSNGEQGAVQRRTTLVSIAAAGLLVILKLGVGLISGSLALISAGIESSGDVVAAILTFFAVRLGRQPPDPEHPYGHGRAENLGALGEAALLLAGGVIVAVEAIRHLISPSGTPDTNWYVFAVIAIALGVDLARTIVSLRTARRYGSPALRSNGFHFAGDMAGSVAVLVGLLLVRAGFPQGDAIAALVIAAIVLVTAIRLIAENANVLMDRTPSEAREAAERALARLEPDIDVVRLRLRESAGRYFADVIVAVAPGQAVIEGHQAANLIEAAIESALPGSDVVVHVEPRRRGLDLRDRVLAVALSEPLVKEVHDITIFEHDGSASVSLHLKFPADLDLQDALAVAERVEREIRARPGVSEVQTHLEPLERPLAARPADTNTDLDATREIERIVLARTGTEPQGVSLFHTETGRVIFLTLGVGEEASLIDAHQLGSELEEELRRQIPDITDVVVHTAVAGGREDAPQ